jgi:DNA-binding transcriptional ArsR family regulator
VTSLYLKILESMCPLFITLKSLYQALGSENKMLVNSALELLSYIAHLSPVSARDLAAALDFSLPALSTVARPPR